jgi:hypothetical protein
MDCEGMASEPQYDASQIIREVGWKLRREVTREAYERDIRYAEDLRLSVCEWRGEDRDDKPVIVTWVATPSGRLLAAYEIQGRA